MKVRYLTYLGVAAVMMSCQKVDSLSPESDQPVSRILKVQTSVEAVKTSISSYDILWGDSEKLNLYYNDGKEKFSVSTDMEKSGDRKTATFSFSITPSSASSYVIGGVYPASALLNRNVSLPSLQYATSDSYDPSAFIMVVKPETVQQIPETYTASFRRAVALNKITLTSLPEDVESVTVTAPGKKLSGIRELDFKTGFPGETVEGVDYVTVNYAKALPKDNATVWFTSWGTDIDAGQKLEIRVVCGSRSYTRTLTARSEGIHFRQNMLNTLTVDFSSASAEEYHIIDFVREYVKILDVWQSNIGTVNYVCGLETPSDIDHSFDTKYAHYVPANTVIKVGGKTYNTADMLETAQRCYLLLRGYDGNWTEANGASAYVGHELAGSTMSGTAIPQTHNYKWGSSPYNEAGYTIAGPVTTSNGGELRMGNKTKADGVLLVKTDILDNFAFRSTNYPIKNGAISNMCGYNGNQLSGYYGCFCSMRALVTYAFFFKYMLDNNLEDATGIPDSQTFRTDLFGSMDTREDVGIWVNADLSSVNNLPLDQIAYNGIGTILLHSSYFDKANTKEKQTALKVFMKRAQNRGVNIHVWMLTFNSGGSWVNPVDVDNQCYNQPLFDSIIEKAESYVDFGITGVHFDYIRYPGSSTNKASLFNYKGGAVTGKGAVTEFCRQAKSALGSDITLSAAMMPEKGASDYYGQVPEDMAKYIDILMPMIYRYSYTPTAAWAQGISDYFMGKKGSARVWAGTTTYTGNDADGVKGMDASEIRRDCRDFAGHADGVVLFRYGLGDIPDLKYVW